MHLKANLSCMLKFRYLLFVTKITFVVCSLAKMWHFEISPYASALHIPYWNLWRDLIWVWSQFVIENCSLFARLIPKIWKSIHSFPLKVYFCAHLKCHKFSTLILKWRPSKIRISIRFKFCSWFPNSWNSISR